MTAEQIQSIADAGAFPGPVQPVSLVETHISWVVLTPEYAFKIKKPVRFGFLDFSTLEKRANYCSEEVRLNKRLAPHMYLGVLPIGNPRNQPTIGDSTTPAIDYAVHMRRMDNQRQMDILLAENRVTSHHLEHLAITLADFHREVVLEGPIAYHPGAYWADFAELYSLHPDIDRHLGTAANIQLKRWRKSLPVFLEQHAARLIERVRLGFWVDGHGDLHARNIFLPEDGEPVIFDCIEFNPHFRQLDILNELAFLCMDMEAAGHPELAKSFITTYTAQWDVFPKPEDQQLFLFFKAYRANVRLKIALLELRQHPSVELEKRVRLYWSLMQRYLDGF